uniref:Proteasome inhibitor PI31 subunit n=1 Tax=Megaselia scalaris TaxID=36166 RepID=T1GIL4_MEGSC
MAGTSGGNEFFGIDLLLKTVEKDVTRNTDIIVVMVHWFLTKNSSFRCIGIGDDRTVTEQDTGSELLPASWNDSSERYTLRYVSDKILYILIGTHSANTFLINLLNTRTEKVSNVALKPNDIVKSLNGSIQNMVPSITYLMDRFRKELVKPVFTGTSRDGITQTQQERDRGSTMSFDDLRFPARNSGTCTYSPIMLPRPGGVRDPIRDVGRSDLMPGGVGGGMIFEPPDHVLLDREDHHQTILLKGLTHLHHQE